MSADTHTTGSSQELKTRLGSDSEGLVEDRLLELVAERSPLEPFEPIRLRGEPVSKTLSEEREDRF